MCAAFKMQIDRNENKRNRLAAVTRNTLAYAAYTYNALEQLTSRNTAAVGAPAGTVHYLYDQDGHLIAEANAATGATTRDYIWLASNDNNPVDLPLAIAEAATLTHVHADHLGRPTRMTDAARATVWQAIWKPWGEVHSLSGTLPQNLRFPGQYYQIETGLHYNHHRNYDPVTGRYTQADPLGFVDGPSVYAYAGNSPYMNVDREGEMARKKYEKPKNPNQRRGAEDRQPDSQRERNVRPPDGGEEHSIKPKGAPRPKSNPPKFRIPGLPWWFDIIPVPNCETFPNEPLLGCPPADVIKYCPIN
jgi:RHS repeat-associated protein